MGRKCSLVPSTSCPSAISRPPTDYLDPVVGRGHHHPPRALPSSWQEGNALLRRWGDDERGEGGSYQGEGVAEMSCAFELSTKQHCPSWASRCREERAWHGSWLSHSARAEPWHCLGQ